MEKDQEYYLSLPYTIELIPEPEGGWFVGIKELPGCMTDTETREEALSEIDQIKREWLEIALESGLSIPEPGPKEEYNGFACPKTTSPETGRGCRGRGR